MYCLVIYTAHILFCDILRKYKEEKYYGGVDSIAYKYKVSMNTSQEMIALY